MGRVHTGHGHGLETAPRGGGQLPSGRHSGCSQQDRGHDTDQVLPLLPRLGKKCRCSNVPRQSLSSGPTLWTPPTMSYPAMASFTETTASSSVGGVPPQRHPPIGLSPADSAVMSYATMASIPEAMTSSPVGGVPPQRHPPPGLPPPQQIPMDTLPALSTENLLAAACVGRGKWSPTTGPRMPTTPGPRQAPLTSTSPRMPASGRQEVGPATPYRQQVHLPQYSSGV